MTQSSAVGCTNRVEKCVWEGRTILVLQITFKEIRLALHVVWLSKIARDGLFPSNAVRIFSKQF